MKFSNFFLFFLCSDLILTTAERKERRVYKLTTTSGNEIIILFKNEDESNKISTNAYIAKKENNGDAQKVFWLNYSDYLKIFDRKNVYILFIVDEQIEEHKNEILNFRVLDRRIRLVLMPAPLVSKIAESKTWFEFDVDKRSILSTLVFDTELRQEPEKDSRSILASFKSFFRWFFGLNTKDTIKLKNNLTDLLKAKLKGDKFFKEGQDFFDEAFDLALKKRLCQEDLEWIESRKQSKEDTVNKQQKGDEMEIDEENEFGSTHNEKEEDNDDEELTETRDFENEKPKDSDFKQEENTNLFAGKEVSNNNDTESNKQTNKNEKISDQTELAEEIEEEKEIDDDDELSKKIDDKEEIDQIIDKSDKKTSIVENKKPKNKSSVYNKTQKYLYIAVFSGAGLFFLLLISFVFYIRNKNDSENKILVIKQSRIKQG